MVKEMEAEVVLVTVVGKGAPFNVMEVNWLTKPVPATARVVAAAPA